MTTNNVLDYEQKYHEKIHHSYESDAYFEAKAFVAQKKYFSKINEKSIILDYGCGFGQNIYSQQNAIGYDVSKYALQFCRIKGIEVTSTLEDIPKQSCDIVFSSHALEHIPAPQTAIKDMYNKLKKDGELILVLPVEKHGKASFELDENQHLYCWNFRTINNLLISNGFQIKNNKYIRGAAYQKLLFLYGVNKTLYYTLTTLAAYLFGVREMMIVATKK
ncbi:MAG: class I SAM-dependent methyltransferase [Chitinophagales bacterium]